MNLQSLEAVASALDQFAVRYLVAGGLAVNAHGYLRYTADIDLVIAFDPANIEAAFRAVATLGYRPAVPITAKQFSDPVLRQQWRDHKGMMVLNFFIIILRILFFLIILIRLNFYSVLSIGQVPTKLNINTC